MNKIKDVLHKYKVHLDNALHEKDKARVAEYMKQFEQCPNELDHFEKTNTLAEINGALKIAVHKQNGDYCKDQIAALLVIWDMIIADPKVRHEYEYDLCLDVLNRCFKLDGTLDSMAVYEG